MPDLSAVLPPIGQVVGDDGNNSLAVSYLSRLAYESRLASEAAEEEAIENLEIYLWGQSPKPADTAVISNHIRDDIDSITDQQTKEPIQIELSAVETEDQGDIYSMVMPTDGPIDPAAAQQMTQPTVAVDPASGQPVAMPGADPSTLMVVNDKVVADFYQKQFDVYWARGRMDAAMRRVVHKTNIYGYMLPVFEWRQDLGKPRLHDNISLLQTYADGTVDSIDEAQFAGVDWWLDYGQAKAMFPQIADQIDIWANTGVPVRPDQSTQLGFNVNRFFQRNTVILRIFWLRHQPCPMSVQDALGSGQVVQGMAPDTDVQPSENMGGDSDVAAGTGAAGGTAGPLLHAATGQEVDPTHPLWPTYQCTRQITQVGNQIVDDIECPYWDMPVVHNVAGFIPNQLYGQGLPQRLKNMQYGRNRALTNMVQHTDLFAHPVMIFPQSTWDQLPAKFKEKGASISGLQLVVPDHIYQQAGGKMSITQPPEPLPVSLVQLQEILGKEMSDRAANPEVLQGKPPGAVNGWQAIQILSQNAQSRFGFAMQWTADMAWRVSKLMIHSMVDHLDVPTLMKVNRAYPAWIVAAIKARAENIDWDIDITINTGTGVIRARKKQEAVEAFNIRDPLSGQSAISLETLRDRLGEDNEKENRRNRLALESSPQFQMQQQQQAIQQQAQFQTPGAAQ